MIVKVSAEGSCRGSEGQMEISGSCWAPGRALSSLHRLLLLPAKNSTPGLASSCSVDEVGKPGEVTKLARECGVCVARPLASPDIPRVGGSSPTLQTHGGLIANTSVFRTFGIRASPTVAVLVNTKYLCHLMCYVN